MVAILATAGDYDTYGNVSHSTWHHEVQATYDYELETAVVHEAPFQVRSQDHRLRAARHVFTHVLQQAWYQGGRRAPLEDWLYEGLADFLSRLPEDPAVASTVDPNVLKNFVAAASDPVWRWAQYRPLNELLVASRPNRLDAFLRVKEDREKRPRANRIHANWAFYAEAALMVHFLIEARGGAAAASFEALVHSEMTGQTGLVFARACVLGAKINVFRRRIRHVPSRQPTTNRRRIRDVRRFADVPE